MRKLTVVLLIAAAFASVPAQAIRCTVDEVPAATLLLPYFEVDFGKPNGVSTLLSINNASATAVLAHVVVWTDLSVPVLDFNIYLTGYDVQTISLRDLLTGWMPQTASAGQDPTDTISPKGAFSQDINFASCNGLLPPPNPLPPDFVSHLLLSLTGKPSPVFGGLCAGRDLGDNIARGYITVDTVSNCTLRFPGDPGYFLPGGTGDATNQNVLWGDYFYVDESQNYASGNPMVHIEASATDAQTSLPGQYTFYGRYVNWTAADNREPLATGFASRYVTHGTFSGGTDLIVWRDSKVNQGPFTCPVAPGTRPPWYPLGQEGIVIFDEAEHPQVPQTFPVSPQPPQASLLPFPAEAQRTAVGGAGLPVPFDFGWIYLNLNTLVTAAGNNPPEDPRAAQAWVTTEMKAMGRFSVGFDAVQLDSACQAVHFTPGP
ncbi:MAG: hypothetical protein DMF53_19285 [Acidobacteria bacterium]|nr:MAG: hypothetical protein DMF53_19285 [Acidobacteriota bacterium]